MIVELNIGLHRDGEPNDELNVAKRAAYSHRVLSEILALRGLRSQVIRGVTYEGPGSEIVIEPTLAARCVVEVGREDLVQLLDMAADRLGQGCIAATADGEGLMVGPLADQYGAFNPDYFVRPTPMAVAA